MRKLARISSIPCVTLALCACASIEGRYGPACPSFAGNTIELTDGRFEWDKFTDQVRVDDAGKVVDAFPDYPLRGSYRIDGSRLLLTADGGKMLPVLHLVRTAGRSYLYTEAEYAAWDKDGSQARCALVLGGFREQE
jgi:hypothetical protein